MVKLTLRQAEVIVNLAKTNMSARAAAHRMFVHPQTIYYNIRQILKKTGKNPANFYDLHDLLPIAEAVLKEGCS